MTEIVLESKKVSCLQCEWKGTEEQLATVPNPFDPTTDLNCCPQCKSILTSIQIICDEPGCWNPVSAGWSDGDTYRLTCYEHQPKETVIDE